MAPSNQYPLKEFTTGEVIFREGQPSSGILVIKSGEVSCVTMAAKRLIPVGHYNGHGILGEEGVLSKSKKHHFSAVALTDVTALEISLNDIEKVLSESSPWLKNVLIDMSEKIKNTTEAMAEHRIVDSRFNGHKDFSSEEETLILNALN